MADPHVRFEGADGDTGTVFRLTGRPDGYRLPQIVVTAAGGPVSVPGSRIGHCSASPPDPRLERAILDVWGPAGPSGYSRTLRSAPAVLADADVTRATTVTVGWRIGYLPGALYDRYLNSTEPVDLEATVELRFETARPAPGMTAPSGSRTHRGHIAVDFGTSNTTVTLFDPKAFPQRPLSVEQLVRLRKEIIDLIEAGDVFPAELLAEWHRVLADVSMQLVPGGDRGDAAGLRDRLARAVGNDDRDRPRVIYPLLLELERRTNSCSPGLRAVLGPAIDRAYRRAWRVPPLDALCLFPVDLDPARGATIDSAATVVDLAPLRVRLGASVSGQAGPGGPAGADDDEDEAGTAAGGVGAAIYAGLKQRLSDPKPLGELGAGVTTDGVIREALRFLVERTDAFIATGPARVGAGAIDDVVITYPTMATPPVRRKLRGFLHDIGVKQVNSAYDEAVAAAMFFVMRDFGGDHDLGLEVLRSRSQPLGERQWEQNVLVVDIGGGTTDIALLTLGLQDTTPETVRSLPAAGRYYELRPEVRGSTGRLQLGGELATLRVFYWLKTRLADLLVAAEPETFHAETDQLTQLRHSSLGLGAGTFAERIGRKLPEYGGSAAGGGPTSEHDILEAVVPTRSAGEDRPATQAFWLLWALAEWVKLEFLGDRRPAGVTLPPNRVRAVLAALAWPDGRTGVRLSREQLDITLTAQDFEDLIVEDVNEMVGLARALVNARLGTPAGKSGPAGVPGQAAAPAVLHRIILAGQASQSWLVRQRLVAAFSGLVGWKPSSIVVEREYGKQATSIGAAWALTSQQLAALRPEGAVDLLEAGRNTLAIDVSNLFFNLPCQFRRGEQLGGSMENTTLLFEVGEELFPLGGRGADAELTVVRSEPFDLRGLVGVFRNTFVEGEPLLMWGDFQWRKARDAGGHLDPAVWPSQMRCQIEVTADLLLYILVFRGERPHYDLTGEDAGIAAAQPLRPGTILVNSYASDGRHNEQRVFDTDEFPECFHIGDRVVRGVKARLAVEPTRSGAWNFQYADADGTAHDIGEIQATGATDRQIRRWVTLTEHGELRVHTGELPFWAAGTLLGAERDEGRVHRASMEISAERYEAGRDPFNGRH